MSFIGEKLLEHSRAIAKLDRQAVTQRLSGKVSADHIDFDKRRVRLVLGQDPATGKDVLSPWVKVQSQSAGAHRTFVMPSAGEQMYLESEGGRVGANSVARYGAHDDENPHPASDPDEWVHTVGNAKLMMKTGRIYAEVGSARFRMLATGSAAAVGGSEIVIVNGAINIKSPLVLIEGGQLFHNTKNVGDSHTNGGAPVD